MPEEITKIENQWRNLSTIQWSNLQTTTSDFWIEVKGFKECMQGKCCFDIKVTDEVLKMIGKIKPMSTKQILLIENSISLILIS